MDKCLDSIVDQTDEVVLVDNGSSGGAVAAFARPGVKLVRLSANRGFAGGVNAGVASSAGDVVALLNDDAHVEPGWLKAAEKTLADDDVAAVAPLVKLAGAFAEVVLGDDAHLAPGDPRPLGRKLTSATRDGEDVLGLLVGPGIHRLEQGAGGERWRWTSGRRPFYVPLGVGKAVPVTGGPVSIELNGEEIRATRVVELVNTAGCYLRADGYAGDCGSDTADDGRWSARRECFALSGTALVTTRSVLSRVGPFQESYFAYYEDTDWCWRARLLGFRLVFDPIVTVRHVRGQTSGGVLAARTRFLAERNRILTLARCAPVGLALREAARKWRGGGDDGVARVLPRALPKAFVERASLRRRWVLESRAVYDRWAGVDTPGQAG